MNLLKQDILVVRLRSLIPVLRSPVGLG